MGKCVWFVRFSNVRDVNNLFYSLNGVCFGQFRVRAKVTRFDKSASVKGKREQAVKGVWKKGRVFGVHEGEKRLTKGLHREERVSEGEKKCDYGKDD